MQSFSEIGNEDFSVIGDIHFQHAEVKMSLAFSKVIWSAVANDQSIRMKLARVPYLSLSVLIHMVLMKNSGEK